MIQMMTGLVTGEELEFMNPSFGDYNKDLPGPGIKKNGKKQLHKKYICLLRNCFASEIPP